MALPVQPFLPFFYKSAARSQNGGNNGALLTVIAGFLLHGCDGAVFVSQEELLQLGHFASQQGDFALRTGGEETHWQFIHSLIHSLKA